ncbi:MAG: hypothetical protein KFF73_04535 [Cyclobacteriaceae bacterium]|nr:hypothetical protein [Cyclobacteriaceae bacterium]
MAHSKKMQSTDLSRLQAHVEALETRLERLEGHLSAGRTFAGDFPREVNDSGTTPYHISSSPPAKYETQYESRVVEHGFAWISAIVYLFGIIFLMAYVRNLGYHVSAGIIGYVGTASLFVLSFYLRKSFPHLLSAGQITGLILMYYVTLRLHFFSADPLISQKSFALVLLMLVTGAQLYFALRKNNEFLAAISLLFTLATALFYDTTHATLAIVAIVSVISLMLFSKYGWWRLLLFVLFTVYLSHALWYLNNPFLGHPLKAVENHQHNIAYLFIYASIFAITLSVPHKKPVSNGVLVSIAVWNAICFTLLMLLVVLGFYGENYTWIFMIISVLCLGYSVLLKSGAERKFAPAFYACFGFMALSVSVYGFSGIPEVYFFLALQSLLVVSMALWFRSRIIVIVNTGLFITILMAYLFTADSIHHISFTFAFIALATARIMNWKKERLTLRTDMLRNIYLAAAFFTILYALYHAVPAQYITLSWTAFAVVYFIMSILLSNIKYRWMAILTILVSSFRLFLVDFARLETGYRVIAFLFFAVIALAVSIYYTKRIKKQI